MSAAPSCPRCGYDLSGAVASWVESSPVRTRCSECGLTTDTVDILRPERLLVRGFVEHAAGFRQVFRWAWRTWAWAVVPPRFWRRVRVVHAPRALGMAAWLMVVFGLPFALAGLTGTTMLLIAAAGRGGPPARVVAMALLERVWLQPVLELLDSGWRWRPPPLNYVVWPLLAVSMLWPACLFLLGTSRRIAKVRAGHIIRAAVYGLAWLAPLGVLRLCGWLIPAAALPIDLWAGAPLRYEPLGINRSLGHWWPLVLGAGFAWTGVWWYMAVNRGLQLPGGRAIWGLLSIASVLLMAVVWLYVWLFFRA